MSSDDETGIHYRSQVVERSTALVNIWMHPRFQLDITRGAHPLGPTEIRVLWFLGSRGASTSAELADVSGSGAPAISKAVAKLDTAGFISRSPHPVDGRAQLLGLTDAGRDVAQQIYDVGDAMAAEILADWSAHDVETLGALLDRFVTGAEQFSRRLRTRSEGLPPADS